MTSKKYKIQQLQPDENLLTLHPETEASVVLIDSSKTGTNATNVESAIKELKDDIPTKTSQLTNDSGFLTEHQDISGKADKTELENYLPLTGGKPMTGNLKMKGNNIIFDNDNEETIEIGEEDNEYSMSIRMENSDYYKGRYCASGFSIGNESINANLDISESKFAMSFKDGGQTSMGPDGFSVDKEGTNTFYEDGKVTRYLDNYSKYVEIELPNKSGTIATIDDIQETANEIKDGVVTGVKGSNETQYRKGQVNITKENIGLGNVNNVAITNDQVTQIGTNKTDIDDLKLKVGNLSGAFKFQGTLNSILDLPNATINNKGYVYIINKKEYVSDGTKWVELGDESSFVLKTTYESHLQTQSNKDNAQDVEIANIKNGPTVVGKAQQDSDGNVIKDTYQKKALSTPINIEGNSRATVEEAISGLNSYIDSVAGVNEAQDSEINNVKDDIANIKDGTTIVGKATRDSAGNVIHQTYVQASQLKTINGESIVGTGDIKTKLEDSGVVAGIYSVVEVNSKGIVTRGAHLIEVGVASQVKPSNNLAVGGIFFQEI